jgi:hypothetical protein
MVDKLIRTIKAVSLKYKDSVDAKGEGSIGFLTEEEENRWYNIKTKPEALNGLLESVIGKGNVIEFEVENGFPKNFTLKEKAAEKQGDFTDDLVSFEDLLNDAHTKFDGNFSVKTEMIQNDWEKQRAIFKATVEVLGIGSYDAYGDATQDNCGEMVKKHYIRMAETRAIARALRWATNNAKAAEEETENGELPDQEPDEEELAQP